MNNPELKANQIVQVSAPRGTREEATVRGITRDGKVVVIYKDGTFDLVDREDIS